MTHSLTIRNETRELARVREFVKSFLVSVQFPAKEIGKVVMAVDEAVANVIEHGYPGAEGEITIRLAYEDDKLTVTRIDHGVPYAVSAPTALDVRAHVAAGNRDGLGLHIIHRVMDDVNYRREGEPPANVLDLVKDAGPAITS
jgi:anti-sigma regulatory factor (Ser/Thr protein kinase)